MGTLYYGDNLDILRRYVKDETVDLVYLDPSFKSDQNYNVLFQEKNGTAAAAQQSRPSRTPGIGTWTPRRPTRNSLRSRAR